MSRLTKGLSPMKTATRFVLLLAASITAFAQIPNSQKPGQDPRSVLQQQIDKDHKDPRPTPSPSPKK